MSPPAVSIIPLILTFAVIGFCVLARLMFVGHRRNEYRDNYGSIGWAGYRLPVSRSNTSLTFDAAHRPPLWERWLSTRTDNTQRVDSSKEALWDWMPLSVIDIGISPALKQLDKPSRSRKKARSSVDSMDEQPADSVPFQSDRVQVAVMIIMPSPPSTNELERYYNIGTTDMPVQKQS